MQTTEDVEIFMMIHGEKIIDALGEEVDRIEKVLKVRISILRKNDKKQEIEKMDQPILMTGLLIGNMLIQDALF